MNLLIYDAASATEQVPAGFNAVTIKLDASLKSDLSWKSIPEEAEKRISQGLRIFWELDLGILGGLRKPLHHRSQFLSFSLAVEQFKEKIWNRFESSTAGISLYRGTADFSAGYLWDQEEERNFSEWLESHSCPNRLALPGNPHGKEITQLYCRDTLAEYLDLIAGKLPYGLPAYILLDTTGFADPIHLGNLLSKAHFPHLIAAIKGNLLPCKEFSWEDRVYQNGFFGRTLPEAVDAQIPSIGVCFPSPAFFHPAEYGQLRGEVERLSLHRRSYRFIPEELLTSQWDGLDDLLVCPALVSSQADRVLRGFCAAGGTVVEIKREEFV